MNKVKQFLKLNLWVIILDVIAVNLSYFIALVVRFYMNGQVKPTGAEYFKAWAHFAPIYTVAAIIIFLAFKLYSGMWQYAGLNDMNRIILANAISALAMAFGSLAIVKRMPITFCVIGALIQFFLTALIRFSYRFLLAEKKRTRRSDKIPALVIGSGDLGRKAVRHLEEGEIYQPVVIIGQDTNKLLDGIPVLSFDELKKSIYRVQAVFIADKEITKEQRETVDAAAKGREIFDYTGALANMTGAVPLTGLLETISGPVTVRIGEEETRYKSGRDAIGALHTRYLVTDITGEKLTVELVEDDGTAYLKEHMADSGEEMSFF